MSDSHLLRLAKLVEEVCWNTFALSDTRNDVAGQLVRDIEAAEAPPAPRTITRAQVEQASRYLRDSLNSYDFDAEHIASLWGLTVEDA